MKQRKISNKLTLNHKTIANLNASGMEGVKGGALPIAETTKCDTYICSIGGRSCYDTCYSGYYC